ncbi:MAG: hypothetical protein QOK13_2363 [Gaiellaceae bacterium]|nr:hypothetical protein [Gaiellaceae bacterium]
MNRRIRIVASMFAAVAALSVTGTAGAALGWNWSPPDRCLCVQLAPAGP